jgi:N-acylneuraminate cytidylyltransferase
MSISKKIFAVIPVRKGSQRVKNKNLRKFNKKNLLIHKIEKLKKVKYISRIIINTDSEEAIDIAKFYKVGFWKREKYYASSKCTNSEFWSHIAKNTSSDYIMFTNCTSPLVKVVTYNKILKTFIKLKKNNDSLNTVTEEKQFLYLNNKALNFNPKKAPNSQNLPNIVKLNFAINIIKQNVMLNKKSVIGNRPKLFKLSELEGLDIDTEHDFEFAEFLHKKLF